MTAPFETFLVFSTNLNPESLGDEAFLRRIQYKMLLRGPARKEFVRIFENVCKEQELPFQREVLDGFIDKYYQAGGKVFQRCHPRDLLNHMVHAALYLGKPVEITEELLELACDTYFVDSDGE